MGKSTPNRVINDMGSTLKESLPLDDEHWDMIIDPTLLILYNGFGNSEILTSGEWVLVPHMSTATP
jgi:hypothetical protein